MKGLIYKDFSLFFRSIDKNLIIMALIVLILLFANTGDFAGLLATIMFSMVIGMQNVMSFAIDEQVSWKKYQLTMPVNPFLTVGGKYISVLLTIGLSIIVSVAFYVVSGIIYNAYDVKLLFISILASIIIPLIWTAFCLPLSYWFGFRKAQIVRLFLIVPVFCFISYFEDGPGFVSLKDTMASYFLTGLMISIALFGISYVVSVLGYLRKK